MQNEKCIRLRQGYGATGNKELGALKNASRKGRKGRKAGQWCEPHPPSLHYGATGWRALRGIGGRATQAELKRIKVNQGRLFYMTGSQGKWASAGGSWSRLTSAATDQGGWRNFGVHPYSPIFTYFEKKYLSEVLADGHPGAMVQATCCELGQLALRNQGKSDQIQPNQG